MSASTTPSLEDRLGTTEPVRAERTPTGEPTGLKVRRWLRYVVLIVLAVLFISPLIFMVVTSFKTRADGRSLPPSWWPSPFSTDAYATVLGAGTDTPVLRWFANSMIAATLPRRAGGHDLGAGRVPAGPHASSAGKKIVFGAIVATLFVPPVILIIPNYLIVGQLVLAGHPDRDHRAHARRRAFGVFFLRQFFLGLPLELEEAAAAGRRQPVPGLLEGRPAAVQAGAGDPGACWRS